MGSLGRLEVQPPEELDDGLARLTVFSDAVATVTAMLGGPLPGPPLSGFKGEMPGDITLINDEQLGNLLNNLSQWCGFLEVEYSKSLAALDEAKSKEDFARSRVRLGMKMDPETGKKLTVQDKNDLVETDSRVLLMISRRLYCETVYSLTRVLKDKAQRDWETASRRITQRGQSIDRGQRGTNVAGTSSPHPAQVNRSFRRPSQ